MGIFFVVDHTRASGGADPPRVIFQRMTTRHTRVSAPPGGGAACYCLNPFSIALFYRSGFFIRSTLSIKVTYLFLLDILTLRIQKLNLFNFCE